MTRIPKARRLGAWLVAAPILALAAFAPGVQGGGPNLAGALAELRATVAKQPTNTGAWVDLGNLLQMDGRVDEAEAAYRRALEADPDQTAARFNLALLLQGKGASSAAYREYRRVLKVDPKHAWAHYQVGTLHEAAGRESAAVHSYAKAFALDPRLRFPDVNPHVIDNRYVTRATLESYRRRGALVSAPNAYQDPGRISGLLRSSPSGADASTPAPSSAPQATTPAGSPPSSAKVVGAQDVVAGRSGMVSGVANAPGTSRLYQPPAYQPAPLVDEEGGPYDEETGSPLVPGATFQPGVQSNGRLEIRWRSQAGDSIAIGS